MNLNEVEKQLFSKVHTRNYFSLLLESECLEKGFFNLLLEPGSAAEKAEITYRPTDGFPMAVERLYEKESNGKALSIVYVYSEVKISLDEVIENTIFYMETMCNETLGVEDFREAHAWEYHPHVKAEDLGSGFYDQLHSIQGVENTYWIG